VHLFGPLLRAVIASASNDHRLGANEAPPAILSVYLGEQLEKVFKDIQAGEFPKTEKGGFMEMGLSQLLKFERDPGDRNRTSPFASTGNRFEFRAVGSSQSVSGPLVAMNTMLADSLNWLAGELEAELKSGKDKSAAVMSVLKVVMDKHGNVVFGGNGYSPEWHRMAVEERGLKNLPTSAEALPELVAPEVESLFERMGVLTPVELHSRFEVYSEQYVRSIELEAKLMLEMATTLIYPAAISYLSELSGTYAQLSSLKISLDTSVADAVAKEADALMDAVGKLKAVSAKHDFDSIQAHMKYLAYDVRAAMNTLRHHADVLETLVADDLWPLPKYREMLFIK
jgi:glutamine synthetase